MFSVLDVETLTADERRVLLDDVRGMVADGDADTFADAERLLSQRIGGQTALTGYVARLMARVLWLACFPGHLPNGDADAREGMED